MKKLGANLAYEVECFVQKGRECFMKYYFEKIKAI
jgi:hypothetical protein